MIKIETLDFSKDDGLLPVIVQDVTSGKVLMLGFANQEAVQKTIETKKVHFYSRTKERLWMKGESSGNILTVVNIASDCDNDSLLIQAKPSGPTCHNGTESCFAEASDSFLVFLRSLEKIILQRKESGDEKSYVRSLFKEGSKKIAQKVVEEAGEVALEAVAKNKDLFKEEAADLLFHYLVLLADNDLEIADVLSVLKARHNA